MRLKPAIKQLLGEIPFTAELYWQLRQNGKPLSKSFSLRRTQKCLEQWLPAVEEAQHHAPRPNMPAGKRVLIFATLRYWIEHATLMGLAMAGLGNQVTLAYLPYSNWQKAITRFDLRRQNAYADQVLGQTAPLMQTVSLVDARSERTVPYARPYGLPPALAGQIEAVACRDEQYTLQVEAVDTTGELYRMRVQRNAAAARAALAWMQAHRPDVLLTPNGSILEMGAVYQAARHLNIPTVTYEFGEQRGRIWLAQAGEVMHQDTGEMWRALKNIPLSSERQEQTRALFSSRQRADLWQNFSRRWQGLPGQGGAQVRSSLGLDARPLVLLAANVIGDSLTLGRQVFSSSMTEWLQRTVQHFAGLPAVQLVVRIHPGERYTKGPSVADVVRQTLPHLPEHIHLVAAADPVNTYDLIEIADLGLVYTTTVGMEMAMSGVPVIAAGQTHYRGKGFTVDPVSWEDYFNLLDQVVSPSPLRLSREQVDDAWKYASRFFFDYPQPFPWHLLHFWNELEEWPMARLLSAEGQVEYGDTFRYLLGEPVQW